MINYGNLVVDGRLVKPSDKITCVVTRNPKRAGSAAAQRFDDYMTAQTVEEYFAAGAVRADLKYDVEHKFFEFVDAAE